ncbi:hypothetical protein [Hyphomonas sp.]|uniref:hypothetical protein n=1 Tax=Hyphomonas sp. TaxID=87 RepID=UPI0032D9A93D
MSVVARACLTLIVIDGWITDIWIEGREPEITIHDYDWGETDPDASRDSDGLPYSKINWRQPVWKLGLSLYPPEKEISHGTD